MKNTTVVKLRLVIAAVVMAFGFTVSNITPAIADNAADAKQLVEKSKLTFDKFVAAKEMEGFVTC